LPVEGSEQSLIVGRTAGFSSWHYKPLPSQPFSSRNHFSGWGIGGREFESPRSERATWVRLGARCRSHGFRCGPGRARGRRCQLVTSDLCLNYGAADLFFPCARRRPRPNPRVSSVEDPSEPLAVLARQSLWVLKGAETCA
jgi:hypothetical protein